MAQYDKEHCCICLKELFDSPTQQVLLKGFNNFIRINEEQEKTNLEVYLKNFKQFDEGLHVFIRITDGSLQTLDTSQQRQFQLKNYVRL